ncbi:MAG: YciI family protein [Rhodospirillaceae bacterium]|nr:YciI family protein [Rhodospirillaceae bacterium]
MYCVAFVTHKPGRVQAGSEIQGTFIDYLRNHPEHPGVVVHNAGPTLADDSEIISGLLLVAEAPSLEAVRAFLADSPYGKADIFSDVQVRRWDWRTGRPS